MALTRIKTWKVLRWENTPSKVERIFLVCPHCETDAALEIKSNLGGKVIAALGLNLIFDPPGFQPPAGFMASEVQCRSCRKIFTDEREVADVR